VISSNKPIQGKLFRLKRLKSASFRRVINSSEKRLTMNFKRIDTAEARRLLALSSADEHGKAVQIVDIRDDEAYAAGHIDSAQQLHNGNLQQFVEAADLEAPLLVYCYHGHMSQGAAAYLAEQGFEETYSLDGGYEAWKGS
jgi:thiosulfate sulfurtransferase